MTWMCDCCGVINPDWEDNCSNCGYGNTTLDDLDLLEENK